MENLQRIQKEMMEGQYMNNPHKCAEDKTILAGEYSFICGQMEMILSSKPKWWNSERPNHKSDKACEKAWEATDDGINEMGLRFRMKGIERMISALSSLIKVAEGEALNQH